MPDIVMNTLEFFSTQSSITNPDYYKNLFDDLPDSLGDICHIVKGLFLNYKTWYEVHVGTEMLLQTDAHFVSAILKNLISLNSGPLTIERDDPEKVFASASDYASLLCSVLRNREIACRKRVGYTLSREFLSYDDAEPVYMSYDIVEYWNGSVWEKIDSAGFLKGEFLSAPQAWISWRMGEVPADMFRGDPFRGEDVLLSNLILDLASINKIELLNWDRYGWMLVPFDDLSTEAAETLDQCAQMLLNADEAFEELQLLFMQEEGLRVPPVIDCMNPVVKPHKVFLNLDK